MTNKIFLLVAAFAFYFFWIGTGKEVRTILIFALWALFVGFFSYNGYFTEHPKGFPLMMAGSLLVTIFTYYLVDVSKINLNALLAIHLVRIPVELVLYELYLSDLVPKQMTFEGWNMDIWMGISAALILVYQRLTRKKLPKKLMIIWNVLGIIILSIVVVLGILSAPLPIQQFAFQNPNVGLLIFPYCYLPTFIVPIVYISHILSIQKYINTK